MVASKLPLQYYVPPLFSTLTGMTRFVAPPRSMSESEISLLFRKTERNLLR